MEPLQSRSFSSNLSELLVFFQPHKSSSTTLAVVAYDFPKALPLHCMNPIAPVAVLLQEFKLTCIYIRA